MFAEEARFLFVLAKFRSQAGLSARAVAIQPTAQRCCGVAGELCLLREQLRELLMSAASGELANLGQRRDRRLPFGNALAELFGDVSSFTRRGVCEFRI